MTIDIAIINISPIEARYNRRLQREEALLLFAKQQRRNGNANEGRGGKRKNSGRATVSESCTQIFRANDRVSEILMWIYLQSTYIPVYAQAFIDEKIDFFFYGHLTDWPK